MTRISDFYDTEDDFEAALDAAELTASRPREIEFVEDLCEKFEEWGMRMYLSEAQHEWLKRLAEGG